jgi:hypothetical protein
MSTTGRSPDSATDPSTARAPATGPSGSRAPRAGRPPAIGRSAINEFRKARAQFRLDRAAAEDARDREGESGSVRQMTLGPADHEPATAAATEPLVLLAHGEPLNLALSRRRRDESASVDRRLRLSRLVAREDRLSAALSALAADTGRTIDLRDGYPAAADADADDREADGGRLAPVVDLRERAVARAEARADAEQSPHN